MLGLRVAAVPLVRGRMCRALSVAHFEERAPERKETKSSLLSESEEGSEGRRRRSRTTTTPESGGATKAEEKAVLDVMLARGLRPAHEVDALSSVREAVGILTERRIPSAVATAGKKVAGVFTARDLLAWLHREGGDDPRAALEAPLSEVLCPAEKIAWCAPRDSLSRVRTVMRALGVRNMPVVCTATGTVLGMLTANDLADYSLEIKRTARALGGKESFLKATHGRSGLPVATGLVDAEERKRLFADLADGRLSTGGSVDDASESGARPKSLLGDDAAALESIARKSAEFAERRKNPRGGPGTASEDGRWTTLRRLELRSAACALANPLKRLDGSLANGRGDKVRALEEADATASETTELSEDAHFVLGVGDLQYAGVFDGVGSWRKVGVDPRRYPRALAEAVASEAEAALASSDADPPRPHDLLLRAWRDVTRREIPGSTTACVVTLDHEVNALSYVNLGDSGLVVLRRGSRVAGTAALQDDDDAHKRTSAHHRNVVLVAPQQLRDFNLPYQLGWTNVGGDDGGTVAPFETPAHANVASFPLQDTDLVILATDGLFDNVSVDAIVDLVADWEETGSVDTPDLAVLAARLARVAREASLDELTDSPFALLAKENDILWSGGMPDDVTVVVLRVHAVSGADHR